MAEEEQTNTRLTQLLLRRKWQIQELKVKRTTTKGGDEEENIIERRRVVRKCEFPEREEAKAIVDFLSSDACLPYLRLCGEEISRAIGENAEGLDWVPIQAWYSEEDATNQHARKGMLYHVLKVRDNDDIKGEGPFVTHDGCKYQEEYTFFWDVDEPPEVPKGRSGVQYELDIKRREDEDGLGGLYDCILVKRTTVEQDVGAYESHKELSETRTTAQMLGVSDEGDIVDDNDERPKDKDGNFIHKSVDEKIADYVAAQNMTTEDGGGIVVDITKEKNADCTTSVTIYNTKEEETPKSTVSAEVTARYIKTVTVDENVPAEGDEEYELNPDGTPKLDDDGNPIKSKYPQVSVGDDGTVTKKTVTKTKGGLRTIQVEKTEGVPVKAGDGTIVCEQTLFEHQHTEVAEAQDKATKEAGVASGGVYKRIQSTLRDDGKFDVQTTETEELPVPGAVVHKSKTGTQFVEDSTDKNSSATETSVTLGAGEGDTDNKIVEVQVTKTPGDRKDIRTITRTPIKKEATIKFREVKRGRSVSQETLFVFENYTAEELAGKKATEDEAATKGLAEDYDGGSLRINEFGLYDGQFTTTEYSTSTDDPNDPAGDEYWNADERHEVDVVSLNGGVYKRTTYWIEVDAYTSKSRKQIYECLKLAKEVAIAAADREQKFFNVRAESPRWYLYESLTNTAPAQTIGTAYTESDFDDNVDSPTTT